MPVPPDLPVKKNNSAIVNGDDLLLKMFSSHGAGFSLAKSQWDVEEEFDLLTRTVRDTTEHIRDRLKALTMLNQRSRELAELNGLIVKGSYQVRGHDQQGNEVAATETTSRLISTVKKGNPFNGQSPFADRAQAPIEGARLIEGPDKGPD